MPTQMEPHHHKQMQAAATTSCAIDEISPVCHVSVSRHVCGEARFGRCDVRWACLPGRAGRWLAVEKRGRTVCRGAAWLMCVDGILDASTGACVSQLGSRYRTIDFPPIPFWRYPGWNLGKSSSCFWSKLGTGGKAISVAGVWVVAGGSWAGVTRGWGHVWNCYSQMMKERDDVID